MNTKGLGLGGALLYRLYSAVATSVTLGLEAGLRLGLVEPDEQVRAAERVGMWEQGGMAGSVRAGMGLQPVWIHAASVGEVTLARNLIAAIKRERPGTRVLLTCNTATGRELADRSKADEVHYFPLDSTRALDRVFALIQPCLVIVVETELWPTFLLAVARKGIPAALVNARISEKTFPRYARVGALIRPVLRSFSLVSARDQLSCERLLELGCEASVLSTAGDLKFDALDDEAVAGVKDLLVGITAPVLVAASTHPGEEDLAVEVFARLRVDHPALRLVVAPRHPERSDQVCEAILRRGLPVARWTELGSAQQTTACEDWVVLVVDTVGDLLGFFPGCVGVFLGGSFARVGGHNLLEPAAFAKPVVCGPHLAGVAAVAADFSSAGALEIVDDLAGLQRVWSGWLSDPDRAQASGDRGREAIERNRGALAKTVASLRPFLPDQEPAR